MGVQSHLVSLYCQVNQRRWFGWGRPTCIHYEELKDECFFEQPQLAEEARRKLEEMARKGSRILCGADPDGPPQPWFSRRILHLIIVRDGHQSERSFYPYQIPGPVEWVTQKFFPSWHSFA